MELNTTRIINQLVSAISLALDIDEGIKLYHAWRVGIFGAQLAKAILPDEKKDVFYACLLHDVGGIGLPDHILHYLLKEEIPKEPVVLAHPLIGAEIVIQIPNLDKVAKFILNHHEWYNGRGYPLGRQHDEIPKAAQIICICDQIDMLIRNEIIRNKTDIITALNLRRNSQFAPDIVDWAVGMLKNQSLLLEEASDQNKIEALFNRIKDDTGEIPIPQGVDAIGVTCEVFSQLIDLKHPYTIGHSKRVSRSSLLIALAMDLPHDELTKIKWAGLLHDIGKLGISKQLLDKPTTLTRDEYEKMKQHATLTEEILGSITDFKEIAIIAASDHERYNGGGYPKGLKGEQIPIGARIITIADAFDAMISDRPYRKGMSIDETIEEIKKNSGTQFDPAVAKEALPVLRSLTLMTK